MEVSLGWNSGAVDFPLGLEALRFPTLNLEHHFQGGKAQNVTV